MMTVPGTITLVNRLESDRVCATRFYSRRDWWSAAGAGLRPMRGRIKTRRWDKLNHGWAAANRDEPMRRHISVSRWDASTPLESGANHEENKNSSWDKLNHRWAALEGGANHGENKSSRSGIIGLRAANRTTTQPITTKKSYYLFLVSTGGATSARARATSLNSVGLFEKVPRF
jgi:hypothetical protein